MNDKMMFAAIVVAVVGMIQIVAFLTGHNGQVFNFTAIIIGGIVGAVFGISINIKGSIKDYAESHKLP